MAGIGLWPGPDGCDGELVRLVEAAGHKALLLRGPEDVTRDCEVLLIDARMVERQRAVIAARKADDAWGGFPVLAFVSAAAAETLDEAAVATVLDTVDDVVRLPLGPAEFGARLRLVLAVRGRGSVAGTDLRMACLGRLTSALAAEINSPVHYVGENLTFVADAFGRMVALLDSLAEAAAEPHGLVAMVSELASAIEDGELRFVLEETPEALRESRQGLDRLADVIGALSRLTLPDTGGPLPVDVGEAVRDAVELTRGIWRYVAVAEERIDKELPAVACDPGELRLALAALLLGAARSVVAATGGRGRLGTIAVEVFHQGATVHVAVSDDGESAGRAAAPGRRPPPDVLEGLGWPLVRDFAARHCGCVDTVSGKVSGNTVLLVLPALGHACLGCGDR